MVGRVRSAIRASSGGELASWCCSEVVAGATVHRHTLDRLPIWGMSACVSSLLPFVVLEILIIALLVIFPEMTMLGRS